MEISSGFLLDQVKLGRQLFDFLDALIILGVTQANVELVMRDPELQRAYATYDAPPPDTLRRPISVNALAQSLRLPFETVRRRVSRLTRLHILKTAPDGVWTPGARVRTPLHKGVVEAGYARTRALHERLSNLRAFRDIPHAAQPWSGPPPLRAVARISSEYLLRMVDLLTAELGDPVDAAIWLEILRSNTAGGASPERLPVTTAAVAKRLGLARETVRRRVAQLVSKGACEHTASGLLIGPDTLARPEYVRIARRNLVDLRRMFTGLAQLGALGSDRARIAA